MSREQRRAAHDDHIPDPDRPVSRPLRRAGVFEIDARWQLHLGGDGLLGGLGHLGHPDHGHIVDPEVGHHLGHALERVGPALLHTDEVQVVVAELGDGTGQGHEEEPAGSGSGLAVALDQLEVRAAGLEARDPLTEHGFQC